MANSTLPFPIQLVNLEKKIASTFLTTVFIGGELFHLSLTFSSEKRFPGNRNLAFSFGSDIAHRATLSWPWGRLPNAWQLWLLFSWPWCPQAKKPLRNINVWSSTPTLAVLSSMPTHWKATFLWLLPPNLVHVWWHTLAHEIEEVWAMAKIKNTCTPLKNKGEMFSLTPAQQKPVVKIAPCSAAIRWKVKCGQSSNIHAVS